MATPDSPKLKKKNGEDVSPISKALVDAASLINNGQSIINQGTMQPRTQGILLRLGTMNDNTCSKPEQNAGNEDTMNGNSSDGSVGSDDGVIKQSPTDCEGSIASNGVPSSDTNPKGRNHARSISAPSNHSSSEEDVAADNVVARSLSFVVSMFDQLNIVLGNSSSV
jgi:hypothetical protein